MRLRVAVQKSVASRPSWRVLVARLARAVTGGLCCVLMFGASLSVHSTASSAEHDKRLGVVVSTLGAATAQRGGASLSIKAGFVLERGDVLVLGDGARCSFFDTAGRLREAAGPVEIEVSEASGGDADTDDWLGDQILAWISFEPAEEATRGVSQGGHRLTVPKLLLPAPHNRSGRFRTRAAHAEFVWTEVPEAVRYRIHLLSESKHNVEELVTSTRHVRTDLRAGDAYSWQVTAILKKGEVSSGWANFEVLDKQRESECDARIAELDDLRAGCLLANVGLYAEAIEYLDRAVDSGNDHKSALRLRAKAYARLGLFEQAYRDLNELDDELR